MEVNLLSFDYIPNGINEKKHYDLYVHKVCSKYIRGVVVNRITQREKEILLLNGYRTNEAVDVCFVDSDINLRGLFDTPLLIIEGEIISTTAYRMFTFNKMKNLCDLKVIV